MHKFSDPCRSTPSVVKLSRGPTDARSSRFRYCDCTVAGCSFALERLPRLDGMFLLYLVIFPAITTHSLRLRSIFPIRAVLLRPAEWRPVRRIRAQYHLNAVSREDGHRGVHRFGKTRRTNPPWFGKNATSEPTVVHENATNEPTVVRKNTTNEPTVVRQKRYERTHRRSSARRKCAERTQIPEPPVGSAVRDETKPYLATCSSELVPCQRDRTTGVFCETKSITELGDRVMDAGRRQNAPNEPTGDCGSVTDGHLCHAGKTRRTNPPKVGRTRRTNPPAERWATGENASIEPTVFWKTRRTNPPDDRPKCENKPGESCRHRSLDWVDRCGQH
jgi:hypothetical protein